MIDKDTVEYLARAACIARGFDPDEFPEDVGVGPYGLPFPDYAPDGHQRPWHKYVSRAQVFLAFYHAVQWWNQMTEDEERRERDLLEFTVQRLIDAVGSTLTQDVMDSDLDELRQKLSNILRGKLK